MTFFFQSSLSVLLLPLVFFMCCVVLTLTMCCLQYYYRSFLCILLLEFCRAFPVNSRISFMKDDSHPHSASVLCVKLTQQQCWGSYPDRQLPQPHVASRV